MSEKELRARIEAHIEEVPTKCKVVFKLSREQGLTNAQIAEQLDIAEKTVEGHITKALTHLKSSLNVSLPLLLVLLNK